MSLASRRVFLYWLLLLVPTLVVGVFAIHLLRREQARITIQAEYTQEARQAAAMGRARLVVENVELLVGDVQAALLDTLGTESSNGVETFLSNWEKNNPLVRTAFLCEQNGRLLRPELNAASEEERGFARRFADLLKHNPPWAAAGKFRSEESQTALAPSPSNEALARKEISLNVAQVQSARRDVQELAKARGYASNTSRMAEQSRDKGEADARARAAAELAAEAPAASARVTPSPARPPSLSGSERQTNNRREKQSTSLAEPISPLPAREREPERRGWTSMMKDGRLHLIGWVLPAGEDVVRGVELELAALISRLAGALPAEIAADEGYALLDDQGRVAHQIGAVTRTGEIAGSVPLSKQTLPGWTVAAYLSSEGPVSSSGAGFFWPSALLVALFVAAILAGGSLLMRQARRSELEALQKTSFVANVSHEFKTPLTTIRLYSELLEQGRVRDAKQSSDYLRTIGRETERLTRLVNNALDFSRLEQGQKKYARERVDLGTEMKRLLDTHTPRVEEAGLTLKHVLPSEPAYIVTDRDAVEQIVLNLIDNACKYAAAGGEIRVSLTSTSNRGVEVCVADRGPGVPTDQSDRIFEKFHRVNDALTAEKTGAGLGLGIARQLARGLGGDLYYQPRRGGGAEFILKIS